MSNENIGANRSFLAKALSVLLTKQSLTLKESEKLFHCIFTEKLSFHQIKAFLLLLAQKGEDPNELLGCLHALKKLEKPFDPKISGLMDTCGTGGDGRKTINISTLAALVIAAAGGKVAKHGNRAISSRSGSSDLMEAFGVKLDAARAKMLRAVHRFGLGYFHAPFYHPVFAKVQSIRRNLKRPTILNLLGPLVNPMKLQHQLVGVANPRLVPLYAQVLAKQGYRSALVCHGSDGMDEISTSAPTRLAWINKSQIRYSTFNPRTIKLRRAAPQDIAVNSIKESKTIAEKILAGNDRSAARDIVALNAAFGLYLCGKARNVTEGIRLAQTVISSGKARDILNQLRAISN